MSQYDYIIENINKLKDRLCNEKNFDLVKKTEDILYLLNCPLFLKLSDINEPISILNTHDFLNDEALEMLKNRNSELEFHYIELLQPLNQCIKFFINSSHKVFITAIKCQSFSLEKRFEIGDEILAIDQNLLFQLESFNRLVQLLYGRRSPSFIVVGRHSNLKNKFPSENNVSNYSTSAYDIKEVEIINLKKVNSSVGFGIVEKDKFGLFIKTIISEGAAEQNGRLFPGDELLKVDEYTVKGMRISEISEILKKCKDENIRIIVSRNFRSDLCCFNNPNIYYLLNDEIDEFLKQNNAISTYLPVQNDSCMIDSNENSFNKINNFSVNSVHIYTIILRKHKLNSFGMMFHTDLLKTGIFIVEIEAESPADLCKQIKLGDRLLRINDINIIMMPNDVAIKEIEKANKLDIVDFVFGRIGENFISYNDLAINLDNKTKLLVKWSNIITEDNNIIIGHCDAGGWFSLKIKWKKFNENGDIKYIITEVAKESLFFDILFPGDELLEVNGVELQFYDLKNIVKLLSESKNYITLICSRPNEFSKNFENMNNEISTTYNSNFDINSCSFDVQSESHSPKFNTNLSACNYNEDFIIHSILRKTNNLLDFSFRFTKLENNSEILPIIDKVMIDKTNYNSIEGNVIIAINNTNLKGKTKSEIIELLKNIPDGQIHLETIPIKLINDNKMETAELSKNKLEDDKASMIKFFGPKKFKI